MNQTILMGKEQVLTLQVTGDVSAETLSFVVSEDFGGSAVITKSGASIDADFKSPYTFVKVTILQADTAGLYAGHKFYSLSGNNGILLQGSVYFQAVASNPYDPTLGYDLRTVRVLAIPASDFNTGDFLQVQEVDGEKAFVNLSATEVRTVLDVAKVQAGTATDLYLKWNNSTSKWENRTLAEIQGDLGFEAGTSTKLFAKWDNAQGKWVARTLAEMQGDLSTDAGGVWSEDVTINTASSHTITINAASYARVYIKYIETSTGYRGLWDVLKVASDAAALSVRHAGDSPISAADISETRDAVIVTASANITINYKILYF